MQFLLRRGNTELDVLIWRHTGGVVAQEQMAQAEFFSLALTQSFGARCDLHVQAFGSACERKVWQTLLRESESEVIHSL